MNEGKDWHPKEYSKLVSWCKENGLDPIKLITGEQVLPNTSAH